MHPLKSGMLPVGCRKGGKRLAGQLKERGQVDGVGRRQGHDNVRSILGSIVRLTVNVRMKLTGTGEQGDKASRASGETL